MWGPAEVKARPEGGRYKSDKTSPVGSSFGPPQLAQLRRAFVQDQRFSCNVVWCWDANKHRHGSSGEDLGSSRVAGFSLRLLWGLTLRLTVVCEA